LRNPADKQTNKRRRNITSLADVTKEDCITKFWTSSYGAQFLASAW